MEKANSIIDISRIPSINTIERIEIPIIQRDYAQGRKERNIKIKRELFLDEIFSVICDSEENDLKLYYIYGKIDGTTFIPIDGQQRLTTLYLLAYYIASRENCFKNFLNLPELTYRTRFSAKNFTAELRKNPLDYTNDSAQKPSEKIKQSGWFFSEYESDPTVIAILTMLDSIHEKYEENCKEIKDNTSGNLDIFKNLDRIKFEVFSLDGKISTDDLYIKMNARGRALSNFDNFNSMIDEIESSKENTKGDESSKENTKGEKFSKKSKEWENTFFNFYDGGNDKSGRDNIGSRALSELIRIILTTEYILKVSRPEDKDEVLRSLLNSNDAKNKYDEIPPSEYRKWLSLDKNLEIIDYLKKSLDVLSEDVLSENKEEILEEELSKFDDLKKLNEQNEPKYEQKIILFAKFAFKVKLKENNINDEENILFNDWLRVIRNLFKNTTVYSPELFRKFIVSTNELLSKLNNHNLDILKCLCDIGGEDLKDLNGFNKCQLKEEIVKAKLISRSDEWKVAIIDAEKPKNIDSKIAFILELSGIINDNFEIINVSNFEEFKSFAKFVEALFKIIYSDIDKADQEKEFLWQRYLLSCKIPYPYGKGYNTNLLLSLSERYYTWKRFFDFSRYQTNVELKEIVKQVYNRIIGLRKKFCEEKIVLTDLANFLRSEIDKNLKDGSIWNSDYDLFIKYPGAMAYCKKGFFIDELSQNNNIYLIKETNCTAGSSPSIKSYCVYLDAKEEAEKNNQKEPSLIIKDYCACDDDENKYEIKDR